MEYKHIFLDLDNTLWDSSKNSYCALVKLFEKKKITKNLGLSFSDFWPVYEEINENLWGLLRDKKVDKQFLRRERFAKTFKHFNIHCEETIEWLDKTFPGKAVENNYLVEGAIDVLEELKKDYSLHIVTNGFKEVSYDKIKNSALKDRFKVVICADELGELKPNPFVYEHALSKAHAKKEESIFIGDDWLADAIGSADFGMRSIFFNRKNENLSDERIENVNLLSEIPMLLKSPKYVGLNLD